MSYGRNAHAYLREKDELRVTFAERYVQAATKEGRISHRQNQIDVLEAASDAGGYLYGPGIDDLLLV